MLSALLGIQDDIDESFGARRYIPVSWYISLHDFNTCKYLRAWASSKLAVSQRTPFDPVVQPCGRSISKIDVFEELVLCF